MTGDEKRAVLGLWGVLGVGAGSIARIRSVYPDLGVLADERPTRWLSSVLLPCIAHYGLLGLDATLGEHGERLLERALNHGMSIAFSDDAEYPRGLAEFRASPPVLFYAGKGDRPNGRRRLAMVGSRNFEPNFTPAARALAQQIASRLVIVSGGARGIDHLCHEAAIEQGGETWAFMGSALDELDPLQAKLAPRIVEAGGTVWSELPPGVRADRQTFPRRNRLISASSDAVLLVRANGNSGALITVRYAREQGRPLFAVPGQIDHETAIGPNGLIRAGLARAVSCADDVFADMGLDATRTPEELSDAPPVDFHLLSPNARRAFEALGRIPADFDALLARAQPLDSGPLASALVELELAGLLVQKPGRRYERR